MLISNITPRLPGGIGFLAVLVACVLPFAVSAAPSELDPSVHGKDLGFVWNQSNVNRNALRFVGTGSGHGDDDAADFDLLGTSSLIYQDGSNPPWNDEGLFVENMTSFDFGIWNQSSGSFDGLILLAAYKGGEGGEADFTMTLTSGGSTAFPSSEFRDLGDYSIFKGGGNRPVDGEAALYKGADGVIFIDLGAGLGPDSDQWWGGPPNADPDDTLMDIHVDVTGANLPLYLHFDVYGYVEQSDPVVTGTNPNSGDLTGTVPEASTMFLFGSGLLSLFGWARRKVGALKGE